MSAEVLADLKAFRAAIKTFDTFRCRCGMTVATSYIYRHFTHAHDHQSVPYVLTGRYQPRRTVSSNGSDRPSQASASTSTTAMTLTPPAERPTEEMPDFSPGAQEAALQQLPAAEVTVESQGSHATPAIPGPCEVACPPTHADDRGLGDEATGAPEPLQSLMSDRPAVSEPDPSVGPVHNQAEAAMPAHGQDAGLSSAPLAADDHDYLDDDVTPDVADAPVRLALPTATPTDPCPNAALLDPSAGSHVPVSPMDQPVLDVDVGATDVLVTETVAAQEAIESAVGPAEPRAIGHDSALEKQLDIETSSSVHQQPIADNMTALIHQDTMAAAGASIRNTSDGPSERLSDESQKVSGSSPVTLPAPVSRFSPLDAVCAGEFGSVAAQVFCCGVLMKLLCTGCHRCP